MLTYRLAVGGTAALVALPVLLVAGASLLDSEGIWEHLAATVLPRYVRGSIALALGTGLFATVIGVACAWLTTAYRFPMRRLLSCLLMLPLAVPGYVLAYCWTDLLTYAGPVQSALRAQFGWQTPAEYWFPQIRSIPGAILVLSCTLYPYVFLAARAAFLQQGSAMFESARSLGVGGQGVFWRVALPLARPGIVAGASLVLMETLADFGTVDYFGIDTFTTGIYRTWEGFYSYAAASKLAGLLLVSVMVVIMLERVSRGKRRFHRTGFRQQHPQAIPLQGWRAAVACGTCLLPILLGFCLPASVLLKHVWYSGSVAGFQALLPAAGTSLTLGLATAFLALMVAMTMAYSRRRSRGWLLPSLVRFASSGYAIPGSVIAIAVIIPAAWFDNSIVNPAWQALGGESLGLVISGSGALLIYAYLVRFLTVAHAPVEQGLGTITTSMDQAARSLGAGPVRTVLRVHVPLLRASAFTALVLVMVDVLKELPATMILRPFNMQTLAVRVHEQVSQESLSLAALPALAIVVTGLVPVIILIRHMQRAPEQIS